jgi:ribosomal protein L13
MQSKVYVVAEEHVTIRGAKKVHKFIRTHSENKGKTSLICIEFAKNRKYIRAAQKLDKNRIK